VTLALIALAGVYPVAALVIVAGIRRLARSVPRPDATCQTVTVVVSARNEMDSLPRCVEALLALDYPADKLSFVLVNDRSTDATGAWLDALVRREARVTVLHTEALPDNRLEAKARGIAHGIARATGEWVLITDADARVPRTWVRHMMGRVEPGVVLVGGAATVEARSWWGAVERATWAFLQTINVGAAGWGRPIVCVGPNIGIRRATYEAAGGLERAPFRIAEDLALFRMGRNAGGVVALYADVETTVTMDEVPTATHVVSQLRRWLGGALEGGPAYYMGVPLALVWGATLAVFLVAGWTRWPAIWAAFVASKLALDILLMSRLGSRLGVGLVRDVPRVWAIQLFAMFWLPLSFVFSRRFEWRGSGYAVKYP